MDEKALRSVLLDVFSAARAGVVSPDAIVDAGVPARFAAVISRDSRTVTSEADAIDAADAWATAIADESSPDDWIRQEARARAADQSVLAHAALTGGQP